MSHAPDSSSTRRSFMWVGLAQVANAVTAAAAVVALTRTQSVASVAEATWLLGLVTVVAQLASMGGSAGAVAIIAGAAGRQGAAVRAVVRWSLPWSLPAGLLAWPVVAAWAPGDASVWAWLAVPWVVGGVVAGVTEAAARATGALGLAALTNEWPRRLALAGCLALGVQLASASELNVALVVAGCGHAVLASAVLGRLLRRLPSDGLPFPARPWAYALVPMIGMTLPQVGVLFAAGDGERAVADFGIALRVYSLAALLPTVAGRSVGPTVAAATHLAAIEPWLRRLSWRLSLLSAAALAVFAGCGRWLLGAAVGGQYRSAYLPCLLLMAVLFATVATGFAGVCLVHRGHHAVVARLSLSASLAFTAGAAVVGQWGATAVAALALGLAAVYGVVLAAVARDRLGVNVWPSPRA